MPSKSSLRVWRRLQVSRSEAQKRLKLEKDGKAKCTVCGQQTMLETVNHSAGRLIFCDICYDMYMRITGIEEAKSTAVVVKAILKAHERSNK